MTEPARETGWRGWTPPSVERPVATFMVVAAIAVFGWVSLKQLPVELMPELSHPTLTVRSVYPGSAPEEVEDAIVRPVEGYLGTVEGLVGIRSVSRAGSADIMLRFGWGANLDMATQKVRERLALVEPPEGADPFVILRYDPSLDPILEVAVSSERFTAEQLRDYVELEVKRAIEELDGVAMVRVSGGEEAVIRVALDERRLAALGLRAQEVVERLKSENVNIAGGRLQEGEIEYLVRTVNALESAREVAELVVAAPGDVPVRLREVATVEETVRERQTVTRMDGKPSVEVRVYKDADANLVSVAAAVRERIFGRDGSLSAGAQAPAEGAAGEGAIRVGRAPPPLSRDAPTGVSFDVLTDQSSYVEAAIDEVTGTAILGGLIATLVLFVFLRSGYATLVIGLAIPLSVIATFAPMRMLGVSLNIMSLGGIALGVGMLVDNAIVVLESIVRCREEGDSPRQAALRGTREVAGAVTASTLTTVAVFFPIVFVEGVAGQLFGDLGLTVVLSLCASLAFALFFVPMMAVLPERMGGEKSSPGVLLRSMFQSTALRTARRDLAWARARLSQGGVGAVLGVLLLPWVLARTVVWGVPELVARLLLGALLAALGLVAGVLRLGVFALGWLLKWPLGAFDLAFQALTAGYRRFLEASLRLPWLVIAVAIALFGFSLQKVQTLGVQLVPELNQGVFAVELTLPVGTRLDETLQVAEALEQVLVDHPDVERVATFVGRDEDEVEASDQGDHSAVLRVVVRGGGDLGTREERVQEAARQAAARIPALRAEITTPSLLSFEAPIAVEVYGQDLERLHTTVVQVERAMQGVPGLQDVQTGALEGFPEIHVRFDRERLAVLGLDVREAAEAIRSKLQGEVATTIRDGERSVDVEVAVAREGLADVAALRALSIGFVSLDEAGDSLLAGEAEALGVGSLGGGAVRAIPLGAVADVELGRGPAEIRHIEGQRAAIVRASSSIVDLGGVVEELRGVLEEVPLAEEQLLVIAGQSDEMESAQRALGFALLLAIFLVYVVMASTFESLLDPFVILGTIPLAVVGVVWALVALSTPVSVIALIGVIVLAGIVVNNAIVLIDYSLTLRRRGMDRRSAIIEACAVRLRPVAITTLTTVLGLVPMGLSMGEGAEIRRPLAWVIIGGLGMGTLLTLLVIPVVHDRVAALVERVRGASPPKGELL